ncbi:MAG: FG-GAP repeat protein [Planctomycetes bacterium]|nr:FG-GAP repeat protein [Planctomycetota bacterium]
MPLVPIRLYVAALAIGFCASIAAAQLRETTFASPVPIGPNDLFGVAVSVDRDTAMIGASDVQGGAVPNSGGVFVYERTAGVWQHVQSLWAADAVPLQRFGQSVHLVGDAAAVGAIESYTTLPHKSGAVYVFDRTPSGWQQTAKVTPPNPADADGFGKCVVRLGDTLFVTTDEHSVGGSGKGKLFVYERSGGVWNLVAQFQSGNPQIEWFGASMSASGDTLFVGALGYQVPGPFGGNYIGRVHIYERVAGVWQPAGHLLGDSTSINDFFGTSVAVSGDRALIGAPGDSATFSHQSVYAYERIGGVWTEVARLDSPAMGNYMDRFGWSVALSGDHGVVGAAGDGGNGNGAGAAYAIERSSAGWQLTQCLRSSTPQASCMFGSATAVSGSSVFVGAPYYDSPQKDAGLAFAFEVGGPVMPYCTTSPNSVGNGAIMAHAGPTSVAQNAFALHAAHGPPGRPGIFFCGQQSAQVPFGEGVLCIGAPITRIGPALYFQTDGTVARPLDLSLVSSSTGTPAFVAGSTWNFQFWYRDPLGGLSHFNTSDGLRATFAP